MKNKTLAIVISLVLSLMFALSGCGGAQPASTDQTTQKGSDTQATQAAAKPDTFIYGIDGDPGNAVNVITTGDRYGLMEIKAVYSPLYMYNGKDSVVYFLAESMTPSSDFLTYTAKLRQGVKWSDGQPFTADDVVFTYEQMLKESNGGWARGQLIFNGKPVKVEKVDNYTVKFTLPTVSMSAMELLGNIFIMPKHVYENETDIGNSPKNATPVGTGPYILSEYKAGEYVKFVKNDNYFLGAPKIANVVFRIIGDANSAQLALQNGEINALAINPTDVSKFASNSKISIMPYGENRIGYMSFVMTSQAVQNKSLREAVLYGLNRTEIINATYVSDKYALPAYSFLPRKATYYTENVNKHDYSPDKAKQLLAQANITNPKLKLAYTANNVVQQAQATIMQQELKAVGIDLQLAGMDGTAMYQQLGKGQADFDMYLGGYIMGIDPDTFNSLFVTGDPSNYEHYSNKDVDALFQQGRVETDPAKRQAIYEQIQQKLIDDAVFYPMTENTRILAIDSNIGGIQDASLVPVYTFEDMSKLYFK